MRFPTKVGATSEASNQPEHIQEKKDNEIYI